MSGFSFWVDSERFSADQRAELAALLPDRLGGDNVGRFLDAAAEAVSGWEQSRWTVATAGKAREQLEKVDVAVRRLQAALGALDQSTLGVMYGHIHCAHLESRDQLPAGSDGLRLHASRSEFGWFKALPDELECLRSLVASSANQMRPSNEPRARLEAKLLAADIVGAFTDAFGEAPPKSEWFFNLVAAVGRIAGITIGKDAVRAVL